MSFDTLTLFEVFDACQRSQNQHKKGIERMKELYAEDSSDFFEKLLSTIFKILTIPKKEKSVERLIDLIVKFIEVTKKENDLREQIISELITFMKAKENSSRTRTCEFLSKMVSNELKNDLAKKLKKRLPDLLLDRIVAVRMEAINLVHKLHNFEDSEDDITTQYLRLLSSDPSIEVRNHALKNIKITPATIEDVINRIKDIDTKIRKTAISVINTIQFKDLSSTQVVFVLMEGLCDRDDSVKAECIKLLQNWFKCVDEDYIKWINFLDFKKNEHITELSCYHLLHTKYNRKILNMSSVPILNCENSSIELDSLFFFRVFAFFLYSHKENISHKFDLDDILPTLVVLCRLISENKENEAVLKQLFLMVHSEELFQEKNAMAPFFMTALNNKVPVVYDFCDESGRRNFSFLLRDLLADPKLHGSLVPVCMSLFKRTLSDQSRFISLSFDVISDFYLLSQNLQDSLNREEVQHISVKDLLKEIKTEIRVLQKKKSDPTLLEPYLNKEAELKQQISELNEKLEVLTESYNQCHFRVLSISYHLLLYCTPYDLKYLRNTNEISDNEQKSNEDKIYSLDGLMQSIVFPSISKFCSFEETIDEENVQICLLTLYVVGQYCLLDSVDSLSENSSSLCYTPHEILNWMLKFVHLEDHFKLKLTSIKSLFDILLISHPKSDYFNVQIISDLFEVFSTCYSSISNKKAENSEEDEDSVSQESNNQESEVVANICVEGFGKLLVANKLSQNEDLVSIKEKLLTKMICLFVAKEVRANQYLNLFFPVFSYSMSTNQLLVARLVVPVMQMLIYSTSQSLTQLEKIGKFMLDLCDMKKLVKNDFKSLDNESFVPLFFVSSKTPEDQDPSQPLPKFKDSLIEIIDSLNTEQRLSLELLFSACFQKKSLKKKHNLSDLKVRQFFAKEVKIYMKLLSLFSFKTSKDFQSHFLLCIVVCLIEKVKSDGKLDTPTKKTVEKFLTNLLKLKMVELKENKIRSLVFGEFKAEKVLNFFETLYAPPEEKKKPVRGKKKQYKDESEDHVSEDDDNEEEIVYKSKRSKNRKIVEVISDEEEDEEDLVLSESDESVSEEDTIKKSAPTSSKSLVNAEKKDKDDSLLMSVSEDIDKSNKDESLSLSLDDSLKTVPVSLRDVPKKSTTSSLQTSAKKPVLTKTNDKKPIKLYVSSIINKKTPPSTQLLENKPMREENPNKSTKMAGPSRTLVSSQTETQKSNLVATSRPKTSLDKKEVSSLTSQSSRVSSTQNVKEKTSPTTDISTIKSTSSRSTLSTTNQVIPKKSSSNNTTDVSNKSTSTNNKVTSSVVDKKRNSTENKETSITRKSTIPSNNSVSSNPRTTISTKTSTVTTKSSTRTSEDNKKSRSTLIQPVSSSSSTNSSKSETERMSTSNKPITTKSDDKSSKSTTSQVVPRPSISTSKPTSQSSTTTAKNTTNTKTSTDTKTTSTKNTSPTSTSQPNLTKSSLEKKDSSMLKPTSASNLPKKPVTSKTAPSTKPTQPQNPTKQVTAPIKESLKPKSVKSTNKENEEILNLIKKSKTKIIEKEIADLLCDSSSDDEEEDYFEKKQKKVAKKQKDIDLLLAVSSEEEEM